MPLNPDLIHHIRYGDLSTFSSKLHAYLGIKGNTIDDTDSHGVTLLMYAARRNDVAKLQLLLANRASIDQVCHRGMTALMYAAIFGKLGAIKCLLNAKADVNKVNIWRGRFTAVDFALIQSQLDALRLLVGQQDITVDPKRIEEGLYPCLLQAESLFLDEDITMLSRAFARSETEEGCDPPAYIAKVKNMLKGHNSAIKRRVSESAALLCVKLSPDLANIVGDYLYLHSPPELLDQFKGGLMARPRALIMHPAYPRLSSVEENKSSTSTELEKKSNTLTVQ